MKTAELKNELKTKNLVRKIQKKRLNLWKANKKDLGNLILLIIESDVGVRESWRFRIEEAGWYRLGEMYSSYGKKTPGIE